MAELESIELSVPLHIFEQYWALCLSWLGCDLFAPRSPHWIALPPGQAPDLFPHCSSEEVIELRKECETKGERDAGMEWGDVAKDVGAGDLWRGEAGR